MPRKYNKPEAFTLVELMISIAIVLILMLGINFVFTTSAKTISTGMALSSVGRDIRGARKTFETDFGNVVSADEMPAIIIQNEEVYAFRDKPDRLADYDGNPATYDADGNASNGDEVVMQSGTTQFYPGTYNFRRHRIDRLSLFVRNQTADYTQQTGDANTFVGATTSSEGWLWYGMLRLATNDLPPTVTNQLYAKPGVGTEQTNPNNFYASQWMLGRKLTLLKAAPYSAATTAMGNKVAASAAANLAYASAAYTYAANALPAAATAFNRETTGAGGPYGTATQWLMPESRIDLANASIATVRNSILTAGLVVPGDADFSTSNARDIVDYTMAPTLPNSLNYIFWAKPFVNKQAFGNQSLTAQQQMAAQTREAALMSPIFLRGCMQFIVEFAGDFYDQGPTPSYPAEPLGTIDYVTLAGGATKTRWYGIGRDVDGDGAVSIAPTSLDTNPMAVPPIKAGTINTPATARWTGVGAEQVVSGQPTYWVWGPTDTVNLTNANNFRPKLIRITLELIDSNGRLQDGQRIEFVYALK